ncbi:MAG: hypothetical protein LQ337_008601 [Flavoplaca oasis]|nr:MAG: hypothetical protein LQ337_008601 [Flavoplaca oasis]
MVVNKRCLLWDWTNTRDVPNQIDKVDFKGPISSVVNWNTWYPTELKNRAPFRPMVRLEGQLSGEDWNNIQNSKENIILFFNEPERAGISPERAAQVWRDKMLPLRKNKGKKLVSPSCASDPAGQKWIADFMHRIVEHPPDFLGVHYYGTDSKHAIEFIEGLHKKFPKPKVFVTEIASISRNRKEVFEFTAKLCNWMDKTDWIFEYAFFGCMRQVADGFVSPEAQLMKPDGSFNELMRKLMHEVPMKA